MLSSLGHAISISASRNFVQRIVLGNPVPQPVAFARDPLAPAAQLAGNLQALAPELLYAAQALPQQSLVHLIAFWLTHRRESA